MKIGICGLGAFSANFIRLFKEHPLVDEIILADLSHDRLQASAAEHDVKRTCNSLEELCASDVDAVAIFVQRQLHGPLTLQALRAGKHVLCAVPIASSLEDVREIVRCVEETRLIYATIETSYYYPHTIYCRDRFRQGDFGHFVYGESAYLHDMSHGHYKSFQRSGGADWKKIAGIPPMYYPTHTTSSVLSVTGARMTHVSCMGYRDRHEDEIFREGKNLWDNPFSDETALMRTSDGGMVRINEFRRVGWKNWERSVQLSMFGTSGAFEEASDGKFWVNLSDERATDLRDLLALQTIDNYNNCSKVHRIDRLPREYKGLHNGHSGSHQFLIDDFIKAVHTHLLPPANVWEAAKYCVPGLIAHESALQEGALLEIPHYGDAPDDWPLLDSDGISAVDLL